MFKLSPNGKGMIFEPNGKGFEALIEYTPKIYSPNRKTMVLYKIFFRSGNGHGKR